MTEPFERHHCVCSTLLVPERHDQTRLRTIEMLDLRPCWLLKYELIIAQLRIDLKFQYVQGNVVLFFGPIDLDARRKLTPS